MHISVNDTLSVDVGVGSDDAAQQVQQLWPVVTQFAGCGERIDAVTPRHCQKGAVVGDIDRHQFRCRYAVECVQNGRFVLQQARDGGGCMFGLLFDCHDVPSSSVA